jgi:hypothetical protein
MIGSPGEVILPRRSLIQPRPEIHKGGDCGACCLGGALGIQVADVYSRFDSQGITHSGEMARCLRCSIHELADRMLDIPAEWPSNRYIHSFGSPAVHEALPWFNHVRMAIDAGYYGLATVDYSGNGGPDTNHWVLICGAKTEGSPVGKLITGDILASCSVNGDKWYESRDFLSRMGGFNTLFVRPN